MWNICSNYYGSKALKQHVATSCVSQRDRRSTGHKHSNSRLHWIRIRQISYADNMKYTVNTSICQHSVVGETAGQQGKVDPQALFCSV